MISKKINNNRNLDIEAEIRAIALSKAKSNPDGFFIENRTTVLKTMSLPTAEETLKNIGFENTMLHFRIATVGVKNETNIHGWENENYQFMHNGGVSDFNYRVKTQIGYKTQISLGSDQLSSDSKILFDRLVDKIKETGDSDKSVIKAIQEVLKGINFWGRGVLIDKVKDKAFLFGEDWYVFKFNEEYIVFSSSNINTQESEFQATSHGVPFKHVQIPLAEATFDGIAIIQNFSKPYYHFKLRAELQNNIGGITRVPSYVNTPAWSQDDLDADAYANGYTNKGTMGNIYQTYEDDDDDNEEFGTPEYVYDDVMEQVPEYSSMNPYDMETVTDENGTHDVYGICCGYGTCWIYNDPDFQEYLEEQNVKIGQMEIA